MCPDDKPLAWLHGEMRTPPFSPEARLQAGYLLRLLQRGRPLGMPASRPLPSPGKRCNELRINDRESTWRIIYRIDPDAVVIVEVFSKKTLAIPGAVLETCRRRLREYDDA